MVPVRRVVLDLLKPHEPTIVEFTRRVAGLDGVDAVNGTLLELDTDVQNIKLTVEGEDIDVAAIEDEIEHLGGSVHSIDQIVCGEYIIEEKKTPQD